MEVLLLIVIVAFIITLLFIRNKQLEFVINNSQCLKLIKSCNQKQCFRDIQEAICYYKQCNSKKQLDNFNVNSYMLSLIEDNPPYFTKLLEDIKYNQINFTRYEAEYNRLLMQTPYDYEKLTRNSIVTAKDFRKIEYKECEKIKLKPVCRILVKVNARYVSPQGRNSYTRTFTFKTGDIVSFFNDYTNAQKYKQSKQYQRSLMTDKLRYKIMKRDNFRCVICGASQKDGVKLHVDHIIPVSKGGKTIESNLRTLCDRCNLGKGASYDPNGVN